MAKLNMKNVGATFKKANIAKGTSNIAKATNIVKHGDSTGKALSNIGKQIGTNFTSTYNKGLGSTAKSLIAGNVKMAAGGAVLGGGINAIRGEDVWDGAKTGAVWGGGIGVGRDLTRAGLGISKKANTTIAQGASDFMRSPNISKQVTTLQRNQPVKNVTDKMLNMSRLKNR